MSRRPRVAEPGELFRISGGWMGQPMWVNRAIKQRTSFVVVHVVHVLGRGSVRLLDPVEGNELLVPPHLMCKLRLVS